MKNDKKRTKLGIYFYENSINQAAVARKAGLRPNRISDLSTKENAHLRADELYLIALAIGVNPCKLLEYVCGDLKLRAE